MKIILEFLAFCVCCSILFVNCCAFVVTSPSSPRSWIIKSRQSNQKSNEFYVDKNSQQQKLTRIRSTKTTLRNLIPIIQCNDFSSNDNDIDSLLSDVIDTTTGQFYMKTAEEDETDFVLCIPEGSDLPLLSEFIVKAFGADTITLSSGNPNNDFSDMEKAFLEPAVGLFNGYFGFTAYIEVLAGLKKRLSDRLVKLENTKTNNDILFPPQIDNNTMSESERMDAINAGSLLLVIAAVPKNANKSTVQRLPEESTIVASVELRLQPCDGKIPFNLPWMDNLERKAAKMIGYSNSNETTQNDDASSTVTTSNSNRNSNIQPYLSTLCVSDDCRGKGLGRKLVRCLEYVTKITWGYSQVHLHVDYDNKPALNLYTSEGYRDHLNDDTGSNKTKRWDPLWAGRAATDIAYLVKVLE